MYVVILSLRKIEFKCRFSCFLLLMVFILHLQIWLRWKRWEYLTFSMKRTVFRNRLTTISRRKFTARTKIIIGSVYVIDYRCLMLHNFVAPFTKIVWFFKQIVCLSVVQCVLITKPCSWWCVECRCRGSRSWKVIAKLETKKVFLFDILLELFATTRQVMFWRH